MSAITRRIQLLEGVAVTTSLGTTQEIECESYAGGMIFIPDESAITTLTFHAASKKNGEYMALYDHDGNAIALTVANGRAHPFPVATYGANRLKLVGNAAGSIDITMIG